MRNIWKKDLILVAGMGRSGTTWVSDIINYDKTYRVLFEPFLPSQVNEANVFEYLQYLNPQDHDRVRIRQARKILTGKLNNPWVDREDNFNQNRHKIIIKDIRCNLMLGWLKSISKQLRLVLTIRHPLQVVDSWRELGWGIEFGGTRNDLEIVLNQHSLLSDFPLIQDVIKEVDFEDFVERTVLLWSILNFIPMRQLKADQAYVLFYENLLLNPALETQKLMNYLDRPLHLDKLAPVFEHYSSTNFRKRAGSVDRAELLQGWRTKFSEKQIIKANQILELFGLGNFYDDDGIPACLSLL